MKNRNLENVKYFALCTVVDTVAMVYQMKKFPHRVNGGMGLISLLVIGFLVYFSCKYVYYQMRLKAAKQTVAPISPTNVQVCLRSYYRKARQGEIFFKCTFTDENGRVCYCQSELYNIRNESHYVSCMDSYGVVFSHLPTILIYPMPNAENSVVEIQAD